MKLTSIALYYLKSAKKDSQFRFQQILIAFHCIGIIGKFDRFDSIRFSVDLKGQRHNSPFLYETKDHLQIYYGINVYLNENCIRIILANFKHCKNEN